MSLVEFNKVTKRYGDATVLRIEHLAIDRGECIGLVGNNGAGKTTAFSLILDLIKSTEGIVTSKGQDVARSEEWKKYTSAFIDDTFMVGFLTPDEYFGFVGSLQGLNAEDVRLFVSQFSEFFNDEIIGKKKYIRDLSKGNQKKVGIIGALLGEPEIIILDEPFASLDPTSQFRLKKIISERKDRHTFLISSHDLSHVADVCTRFIILEKGQVIMDNPRTEETVAEMNNYFTSLV